MALSAEASETIVAREAAIAFLIEMSFVSETKRVWTGFGPLVTSDARRWDGIGELARIEGLGQGIGTSAPAGKIVASGVSPEVLASAVNATEYKDRPLAIYLQPFNVRAVYGPPVILALRIMKSLEISRDASSTRTIAINHEGPYTGRRRPAGGYYSDRDQQKRFPGDRACERVFGLLFKQENWPNY